MAISIAISENSSAASRNLACEHCHRPVPLTFEVLTDRICESCAQELNRDEILAELSAMYDTIFGELPGQLVPGHAPLRRTTPTARA